MFAAWESHWPILALVARNWELGMPSTVNAAWRSFRDVYALDSRSTWVEYPGRFWMLWSHHVLKVGLRVRYRCHSLLASRITVPRSDQLRRRPGAVGEILSRLAWRVCRYRP